MKTNGRTTIYANYTEKQLLSGSLNDIKAKVIDILTNSQDIHQKNKIETMYLVDYYYGDQDIKDKTKKTRTDINNKSVENWAYAFVDWKKTFLLGKPIQYSPKDVVLESEVIKLNGYTNYEDKKILDLEIMKDMLVTGRGFRFIDHSPFNDEDEAPFELINVEPWLTECVYSSGIGHEQIASYYETPMSGIEQQVNPVTNEIEEIIIDYQIFTFYTRNHIFKLSNEGGVFQFIGEPIPVTLKEHMIVEYYIDPFRFSMIEMGKDIFNDINYVQSLDMDDIEAFVNSIMVFKNAEIDKEGMNSIVEYGALSIKSSNDKSASVELLQSRLKSLDTQIFYLRKLTALHSILSVPMASNSGEVSNAETGKAVLTGQGFTSASVRVEGEQLAFEAADQKALKTILKICKKTANSGISKLKVSDIDIKFNRDMSENILVKTQALINLQSANIPPEIRNSVVGLFNDPVSVTKLQEKMLEQKIELESEIENINIQEQNNKITQTEQSDLQDQ